MIGHVRSAKTVQGTDIDRMLVGGEPIGLVIADCPVPIRIAPRGVAWISATNSMEYLPW